MDLVSQERELKLFQEGTSGSSMPPVINDYLSASPSCLPWLLGGDPLWSTRKATKGREHERALRSWAESRPSWPALREPQAFSASPESPQCL